jgi:transposase
MHYLGIDVSKDKLDVFLNKLTGQFQNNAAGFKALVSWLKKKKVFSGLHACLEATGKYGHEVAEYLHEKGIVVSVVNPCLIKNYAASLGLRNKTDLQDAETIARFCEFNQPSAWEPPSEAVRDLVEMTRTIDALKKQRQALANRLEGRVAEKVRKSLEVLIASLEEQIRVLGKRNSRG